MSLPMRESTIPPLPDPTTNDQAARWKISSEQSTTRSDGSWTALFLTLPHWVERATMMLYVHTLLHNSQSKADCETRSHSTSYRRRPSSRDQLRKEMPPWAAHHPLPSADLLLQQPALICSGTNPLLRIPVQAQLSPQSQQGHRHPRHPSHLLGRPSLVILCLALTFSVPANPPRHNVLQALHPV